MQTSVTCMYVVSPHRSGVDATPIEASRAARDAAVAQLRRMGFDAEPTEGSYKGALEPSFALHITAEDQDFAAAAAAMIAGMAIGWRQESILCVEADGRATLAYTDGRPGEAIGQWRAVTREEAHGCDGFTYFESSGAYFVAAPSEAVAAEGGAA